MTHWILKVLLAVAPMPAAPHLPPLADDVAVAVSFGPLPFSGPAGREASALALLVIAEHEGARFNPRVASCAITADEDRTVSLFGLMRGASWRGHTRNDLCAGGPLPAYLSLLTLEAYSKRCPLGGPGAWFRGYASGRCSVKSDAARDMCSRWESLARQSGLVGASCWGPERPIAWASVHDDARRP